MGELDFVWTEWFAWHPIVTTRGERVWWKKVYRCPHPYYHAVNNFKQKYLYRTAFDFLTLPTVRDDENGQGPVTGTTWFNTAQNQLMVFDGNSWVKVMGPNQTP